MLKSYFTIGWRNLLRNRAFSGINIFGLSIGMTCTILILLWVRDELSFNKSHRNYSQIYQVMAHRTFNNQTFTDRNMVMPLAAALEKEIPQIKNAVVTTHPQTSNIRKNDTPYGLTCVTTSTNFLEVFTVDFISKSSPDPIDGPSSIVLTQSAAKAIFGDENPLEQTLDIGQDGQVKVTGVIADLPSNSSMQLDALRSFDYSSDNVKQNMERWSSSSWEVYIETLPGADMELVNQQINEIKYRHDHADREISTYFAWPMEKWRLYSDFDAGVNTGGMIEYVRLFTVIAIIILVIACVNFMNLSTARSEKRAKEVGIRKTLGSLKNQLVYQFFTESIILSLIAFCLSMVTVLLLLPSFNQLVDKQLFLNALDPAFWVGSMLIIVFTGILAGSYPALFLSSFNPVKVLKGTVLSGLSGNSVKPRQVLIVFQFVVSTLLISATILVYQQIGMIKGRDIGYDPNNLISILGPEDTQRNFEVIKQELQNTGLIHSVTRTMSPMTDIWWRSIGPDWKGRPDGTKMIFSGQFADAGFSTTMGITMLEGRDFSGSPVDSSYVLLNKTAVDEMGLDEPLGLKLIYGEQEEYTVLGVTDDVVQESPFEPVDPMIIFYSPGNTNYISLRLRDQVTPKEALPVIEKLFRTHNPNHVFDYRFVDQEFERKFLREDMIRKLSNIFAILAIFICCIGLAGLAAFTIEKRTREIGVRKVLGATVQHLLILISRDFLKLVLVALAIAIPLTWWLMDHWLENYPFRVEISMWLFVSVGLAIVVLALAVVGLNTLGAALRNPVNSLRIE